MSINMILRQEYKLDIAREEKIEIAVSRIFLDF